MFSYTSGTTGDPKGVMLSHKMILGAAYAVNSRLTKPFDYEDCYISYLPAAHSFECTVSCAAVLGMRRGLRLAGYVGGKSALSCEYFYAGAITGPEDAG